MSSDYVYNTDLPYSETKAMQTSQLDSKAWLLTSVRPWSKPRASGDTSIIENATGFCISSAIALTFWTRGRMLMTSSCSSLSSVECACSKRKKRLYFGFRKLFCNKFTFIQCAHVITLRSCFFNFACVFKCIRRIFNTWVYPVLLTGKIHLLIYTNLSVVHSFTSHNVYQTVTQLPFCHSKT